MEELKPCPFCGGEAKFLRAVNTISGVSESGFIECSECGCFLPNADNETEAEMTQAWNTRPTPDTGIEWVKNCSSCGGFAPNECLKCKDGAITRDATLSEVVEIAPTLIEKCHKHLNFVVGYNAQQEALTINGGTLRVKGGK